VINCLKDGGKSHKLSGIRFIKAYFSEILPAFRMWTDKIATPVMEVGAVKTTS
jgi:hypothetical protein